MERLPGGARRLAVQLKSTIPADVFWDVLTDYTHLADFIPNLSSSELVMREGETVRLQQVGSQQLLGMRFSAQVLLELREFKPDGMLRFLMLKGDFRRFELLASQEPAGWLVVVLRTDGAGMSGYADRTDRTAFA